MIDYLQLFGHKPATAPANGKGAAHDEMRARRRRERPTKDELEAVRARFRAYVISSGPRSTAEVAAVMDCTEDYALKRLHDLRKDGSITLLREAVGRRVRYLWGAA